MEKIFIEYYIRDEKEVVSGGLEEAQRIAQNMFKDYLGVKIIHLIETERIVLNADPK